MEARDSMRATVVYESIFGNTKEIAEAIARGLATRFEVNTSEVSTADPGMEGVELLVIGGPTHAWGMSRGTSRTVAVEQAANSGIEPVSKGVGIRDWLKDLPNRRDRTLAATFDTALKKPRWFPVGSAARSAASQLKKRGFEIADEPEQVFVRDSEGPLLEGELERAEDWGRRLGGTAAAALPAVASAVTSA